MLGSWHWKTEHAMDVCRQLGLIININDEKCQASDQQKKALDA
jgi:hypothetical protein